MSNTVHIRDFHASIFFWLTLHLSYFFLHGKKYLNSCILAQNLGTVLDRTPFNVPDIYTKFSCSKVSLFPPHIPVLWWIFSPSKYLSWQPAGEKMWSCLFSTSWFEAIFYFCNWAISKYFSCYTQASKLKCVFSWSTKNSHIFTYLPLFYNLCCNSLSGHIFWEQTEVDQLHIPGGVAYELRLIMLRWWDNQCSVSWLWRKRTRCLN